MSNTNLGAAIYAIPANHQVLHLLKKQKSTIAEKLSIEKEQSFINEHIPDSIYENLPDLLKESCQVFTDKHEEIKNRVEGFIELEHQQ